MVVSFVTPCQYQAQDDLFFHSVVTANLSPMAFSSFSEDIGSFEVCVTISQLPIQDIITVTVTAASTTADG